MNPQCLVGTQAFLPATLKYIRDAASPATLPIDHVLLQSILLCLIAQDKHLIIRAPEEDVGLAIQLTVWMLSSVFDLKTHKVKIRKSQKNSTRSSTPGSHNRARSNATEDTHQRIDDFLRSLFLHSTTSTSSSNQISQDEESFEGHVKHTHLQANARRPNSRHIRQASVPTNLVAISHGQARGNASTDANLSGLLFETPLDGPSGSSPTTLPSILKPQPLYAFPRPGQIPFTQPPSPRLSHAHTDPLPVPSSRRKKSRSQFLQVDISKNLPQALVISGLENASSTVQRSFSAVLGDKKVLLDDKKGDGGEWMLPEGFICVYVCPWSARERPAIHKTLLDKFAMSTNVSISQSTRSDLRLLPFLLSSVGASPKLHHSDFSYSSPGSPSASIHLPLPPTPPTHMTPLPGHGHHSPVQQSQIQRSSVQHGFSLTPPFCSHPLPQALHSPPLLQPRPSTPLRLPPLLPSGFLEALRSAYRQTHAAYSLDLYLSDLMSATRHNSRLDGTLLTAQSIKDARDLVKASRVLGADLTGMELLRPVRSSSGQENEEGNYQTEEDEEEEFHSTHSNPEILQGLVNSKVNPVLEVSEVDVARIFPRVVSHRLRLREGPHDEVLSSVLYGATVDPPLSAVPEGEKTFDSVKAVLVSVLSEV